MGDDEYEYPDQYEMDDYDPGEECGRWVNGKLGRHCAQAGTEFCDWDCPYRNRSFLKAP